MKAALAPMAAGAFLLGLTISDMERTAGFFAHGIRVSWPLATVTIDTAALRLTSRFVRSVSPYARRHEVSDLVISRDQVHAMSRHGLTPLAEIPQGCSVGIPHPGRGGF
jgi:hypothetical protein